MRCLPINSFLYVVINLRKEKHEKANGRFRAWLPSLESPDLQRVELGKVKCGPDKTRACGVACVLLKTGGPARDGT